MTASAVSSTVVERQTGADRVAAVGGGEGGGQTRPLPELRDDTVVVRSALPTPVGEYLNPINLFRTSWRQRDLIRQFTAREVLERNRGSHLGVVWNILSPLLQLAAFTFVFGVLFQKQWGNVASVHPTLDFVFNLFVGQTIFHIFAETMSRGPVCVSSRSNFVRKVVFPVEILPVSVVLSGIVYEAIAMGLLLVLLAAATGGYVSPTLWALPIVILPLVMMCLGLSWFLASLGAFFRDIRNVTVVITQVMLFFSAIFYPLSTIPEDYRWLMEINPLVVIIESARNVVIEGSQPQWGGLGVVAAVSFAMMMLGYAWFMKSRKGLADVV